MNIVIVREIREMPDATLGVFYIDDKAICATLELPWLNNQHGISCIPTGIYKVTKFLSPTKGNVFLLHNVPNRDMIEIHKGNNVDDIKGCILVGMTGGTLKGKRAVQSSGKALTLLLGLLPSEFNLEIE